VVQRPRQDEDDGVWSDRYAELQPRLIRALAATVGSYSGVEDAVQEAFTEMLAHDQEPIANLGGWLYTVALRHLRRGWRRESLARALRLSRPEVTSDVDRAIQRADLLAALAKLSPRDRELVILKHYFRLTQDEIAATLNISRGTVSAALTRAVGKLRELERRAT
jgi:RNA polymerase sigma factor (sigma-70 family)